MERAALGHLLAGVAVLLGVAISTGASGCSYDFTLGPEASGDGGSSGTSGGGSVRTCKAAARCDVECLQGGCTTTCASGGACEVNCSSNCVTTCPAGASCTVNCAGGGCKTTCATGSSCSVNCVGASCVCTGGACPK